MQPHVHMLHQSKTTKFMEKVVLQVVGYNPRMVFTTSTAPLARRAKVFITAEIRKRGRLDVISIRNVMQTSGRYIAKRSKIRICTDTKQAAAPPHAPPKKLL